MIDFSTKLKDHSLSDTWPEKKKKQENSKN